MHILLHCVLCGVCALLFVSYPDAFSTFLQMGSENNRHIYPWKENDFLILINTLYFCKCGNLYTRKFVGQSSRNTGKQKKKQQKKKHFFPCSSTIGVNANVLNYDFFIF